MIFFPFFLLANVSALGLKPKQDMPLGLPGLVGPKACPGCRCCAGGPKPKEWASCPSYSHSGEDALIY
ncbi:unnamed protein product [Prunus armeniaca]